MLAAGSSMQLDSYSIKATRDGLRHHCDDVLVPAGAEPVIQMPLVHSRVHWHDEFNRVVERCVRRRDRAARLQVAPLQRTMNAVEDEDHASSGSFDPHLHEALEEGRTVEIEHA